MKSMFVALIFLGTILLIQLNQLTFADEQTDGPSLKVIADDEGIFKARNALVRPGMKSIDKSGNVVLNGRMDSFTDFEMRMGIEKESELSIVICRQGRKGNCTQNGLVLCYHSPPNHIFPLETPTNEYLEDTCNQFNGFIVSTETLDGQDFFRIDTRFGNTYRLKIPQDNCFVLLLAADLFAEDSEEYKKQFDNRVLSVFANIVPSMNNTQNVGEAKFEPTTSVVAVGQDGKPIRMLYKEIMVWPRIDSENGLQSIVRFMALGGGDCCALTAKILGRNIQKCWGRWAPVGDRCQKTTSGVKEKCTANYTTGYNNYVIHKPEEESKRKDVFNMLGKTSINSVSTELVISLGDEVFEEVAKPLKNDGLQVETLDLSAALGSEPSAELSRVEDLLEGHLIDAIKKSNSSKKAEWTTAYLNKTLRKNIHESLKKRVEDVHQAKISEVLLSNLKEFAPEADYWQKSASFTKESHSSEIDASDRAVFQQKQLEQFCYGMAGQMDMVIPFTNDKETVAYLEGLEKNPNEPNYDKCPFSEN